MAKQPNRIEIGVRGSFKECERIILGVKYLTDLIGARSPDLHDEALRVQEEIGETLTKMLLVTTDTYIARPQDNDNATPDT